MQPYRPGCRGGGREFLRAVTALSLRPALRDRCWAVLTLYESDTANSRVDVSLCILSRVIPLNPSKAPEHHSPRGANKPLKTSNSVTLSDLKVTLGGVSGGRGGA